MSEERLTSLQASSYLRNINGQKYVAQHMPLVQYGFPPKVFLSSIPSATSIDLAPFLLLALSHCFHRVDAHAPRPSTL